MRSRSEGRKELQRNLTCPLQAWSGLRYQCGRILEQLGEYRGKEHQRINTALLFRTLVLSRKERRHRLGRGKRGRAPWCGTGAGRVSVRPDCFFLEKSVSSFASVNIVTSSFRVVVNGSRPLSTTNDLKCSEQSQIWPWDPFPAAPLSSRPSGRPPMMTSPHHSLSMSLSASMFQAQVGRLLPQPWNQLPREAEGGVQPGLSSTPVICHACYSGVVPASRTTRQAELGGKIHMTTRTLILCKYIHLQTLERERENEGERFIINESLEI